MRVRDIGNTDLVPAESTEKLYCTKKTLYINYSILDLVPTRCIGPVI